MKTRILRTATISVILILGVILAACTGGTSATTTAAAGQTTQTGQATQPGQAAETNEASPAEQVLDAVYDSVVNVAVQATVQGRTGGGIGSGVVYTADGYILTNAHVVTLDGMVTSGQTITVTFSSGESVPATLVGSDAGKDVAAIKVEKTGLHPVTFAASGDVKLAEWAIVIGSPLDFRNSVSLGIVSGLDRTLDVGGGQPPLTGLIQIDAAISPGNSGGGCFDESGHFVGMPEVYLPPQSTGAENIGFAIPADVVAATAKALTGK